MTKTYAPFTLRVIAVIQQIPPGEVMSYGEVARLAGSPRAARQVVRILHTLSGEFDLPWHRVVGKGHKITLPGIAGAQQRQMLKDEGLDL